jgi:hypothetical protein
MSRTQRSDSETSDPGAAQFITNRSPKQLQHLQFWVPDSEGPGRVSQFLEEPRQSPQIPIPNRFTVDLAKLKENNGEGKHARKESEKSAKSLKSGIGSDSNGSRISVELLKNVDLLKEVEKKATVVASIDWRFYVTGISLCFLNLVAAWDATMLPMSLPVS